MTAPPETFYAACRALQLEIPAAALERLGAFLDLLLEHNRHVNLTAIRSPADAWQRHILESVALAARLPAGGTLADVGSGGGLPGLPLAILRADLTVTLIEATLKKARFLGQAAADLGLKNVRVLPQRAEQAGQERETREQFDMVTARAVAALPALVELCVPLLRVNGVFLAVKGARWEEELAAAKEALRRLKADCEEHGLLLPGTDNQSVLLAIRKRAHTPPAYPRAAGTPQKKPLGLQ